MSEASILETPPEKEMSLRDMAIIYRRRRKLIYSFVIIVCALVAVYCAICTRRYEAVGTIEVQKESSDGMGLDDLMSGAADSATSDLEANIVIATQASILESDTLALTTIETLNLENTPDFKPHWSPLIGLIDFFSPAGITDPPNAPLEDAPERRRRVLKVFGKNLKVNPITGTRLIEIDYMNPDPKLAAAIVNELTKALADYTFQTRYTATQDAAGWLRDQLGDLRKDTEGLQKKVVDLQASSGVYSLGTVDAAGKELAYSGVLDQLQQATTALALAKQNSILRGAILHAAESGDAEMLSGLAGNSMAGAQANNTLQLISDLRQQEAAARATLDQAQAKFGPSYPRIAELRANLSGIDSSIHDEIGRIAARARTDFDVAKQAEASTSAQYDQAKAAADKLNDKAIQFAIVRQDAEDSRMLYEGLLTKLKQAGVLEGLKSSNITVVDPGRVPSKPKRPNVPLYMGIALVGGFFLGCGAAFLVDNLDNKINSIRDAEEIAGQKLLGATPDHAKVVTTAAAAPGKPRLFSLDDPQSTYTEALRTIRTGVLLTAGSGSSRVIMITSSIPGEGKTVLSSNLSVVLAQSGKKVLLVDLDLRRGVLRHRLNLPKGPGLSDLLAGQVQEPPIESVPGVPNLDALQAGNPPPSPADLLGLAALETWIQRWREKYDFVILDSAPLLPVTDAMIVNPLSDITLVMARVGVTERPQLRRSLDLIAQASNHFVGVILNGLRPGDENYYGYYGYRKYESRYGDNGENNDA